MASQSLLHFFDILQQTGFSKSPKSPPFTILKTLRFLSLGYSADFRRSRLVNTCVVSAVRRECGLEEESVADRIQGMFARNI